jgi:hypothetical protein
MFVCSPVGMFDRAIGPCCARGWHVASFSHVFLALCPAVSHPLLFPFSVCVNSQAHLSFLTGVHTFLILYRINFSPSEILLFLAQYASVLTAKLTCPLLQAKNQELCTLQFDLELKEVS